MVKCLNRKPGAPIMKIRMMDLNVFKGHFTGDMKILTSKLT